MGCDGCSVVLRTTVIVSLRQHKGRAPRLDFLERPARNPFPWAKGISRRLLPAAHPGYAGHSVLARDLLACTVHEPSFSRHRICRRLHPMADVFLSYARVDQVAAERLRCALEKENLTVWWDQHLLPVGDATFDSQVERQIPNQVACWSFGQQPLLDRLGLRRKHRLEETN